MVARKSPRRSLWFCIEFPNGSLATYSLGNLMTFPDKDAAQADLELHMTWPEGTRVIPVEVVKCPKEN